MTRNYIQVGAGGTGSYLFPALLRYLDAFHTNRNEEFTYTIIDGKELEASKLQRQLFFGRYAGSNKARSLAEQYEANPNVVIAIPEYLSKKNIKGIKDNDVVLICADNFPVRARIEAHARTLDNITVINGGNEMYDGSLQTYLRRNGIDITPPLSQGHPEILTDDKRDPTALSCQQIAELPSGEQTLIANMISATAILNAVRHLHQWEQSPEKLPPFEEVFFDLDTFAMRADKRPAPRSTP